MKMDYVKTTIKKKQQKNCKTISYADDRRNKI